jgi:hypothetical protein
MNKLAGFSVVVLMLAGCGKDTASDRPETAPVTGVVTYKGELVEGATVVLMATSQEGRGAMGLTDASGKFNLMTFEPGDGAIPGSYGVKISKVSGGGLQTQDEAMAMMESGGMPQPTEEKDLLPAKYKDEKTSGLTADVKEGENEFTFELTD